MHHIGLMNRILEYINVKEATGKGILLMVRLDDQITITGQLCAFLSNISVHYSGYILPNSRDD